MKFSIHFKHKKVFIWYTGYWINIPLMAAANGGGIKGYYRFFKGLFECMLEKHQYINVFKMSDMKSHVQCSYCRKEKKNEKDTVV